MQTDFVKKCEEFAVKNFSLKELRPAQREVLTKIYDKKYVIATLPTGAGKTLLYSLPALFFENSPVLVISPLISLMRDQQRRMKEANIPCVIFTSDQSDEERKQAWSAVKTKQTKIIFASPERFVLPSFLNAISKINLSMIVIDEAHCIVSWGHHFRPEYSEIGKVLSKLNPMRILALTATAARSSRQYIVNKVFPEPTQVFEYSSKPLADNIVVKSIRLFSAEEQWKQLLECIEESQSQKILVYFQSRQLCEDSALKLRKKKIHSIIYHAGLQKFERKNAEEYIHSTKQKTVVCATTAFGMGVDVAGIRTVVVYGYPNNIEELFQMLGRAGRGGETSEGLLLWMGSDPIKREYKFKATFPEPTQFLKNSANIAHFMPKKIGESCFVSKASLLEHIQGKHLQDKTRKLESIFGGLRICNCLEDPRSGESYYHIKLLQNYSFLELLACLPQGITRRKKVFEGLQNLVDKNWLSLKNAECVVPLKMLIDASEMTTATCEQVFYHYKDQNLLSFVKIDYEQAKDGIILKNGYMHLQKELPRYISARSNSHASLRELDKLTTSTTCRLFASYEFFAPRSVQGASKNLWRCMQCDLCIRKRIS